MARAVWSGSLSFGLVNIPVRLYPATTPKDVRFHEFQAGTGRRIHHLRVASPSPETDASSIPAPEWAEPPGPGGQESPWSHDSAPDEEAPWGAAQERDSVDDDAARMPADGSPGRSAVPYQDVVKGIEVSDGRYVMVTPDEIEALRPAADRTITIEDFVDLERIDAVYFEKTYYVAPQRGEGTEKPYSLLLQAMQRSNKVGIARFVMRTREYLAAIRPMAEALALETLFFADEIRPIADVGIPPPADVSERELRLAEDLIGFLATEWDPARYRDTFRERVLELIQSKAGQAAPVPEEEEATGPSRIPDLMAALKASVEAARAAAGEAPPRRPRKRRTG